MSVLLPPIESRKRFAAAQDMGSCDRPIKPEPALVAGRRYLWDVRQRLLNGSGWREMLPKGAVVPRSSQSNAAPMTMAQVMQAMPMARYPSISHMMSAMSAQWPDVSVRPE